MGQSSTQCSEEFAVRQPTLSDVGWGLSDGRWATLDRGGRARGVILAARRVSLIPFAWDQQDGA